MNRRMDRSFALVTAVAVLLTALVLASGTALGAVSGRIVVLLPPKGAVGREFFPMMEVFEEHGVGVDVAAESLGPYTFWEATPEGRFSGAAGGYEFEIEMVYEDVVIEEYEVFVVGPGFAHTTWLPPSNEIGKALIEEVFNRAMPVGGVSWGATLLVTDGFLDGRTTARPPFYDGVIYPLVHMSEFLSNYDAIYGTACVCIDRGEGISPVVTANFHCVRAFAELIVDEFFSD